MMGRPPKNVDLREGVRTKAEVESRSLAELTLTGADDKVKPSARLNSNQKKIFNYIVTELEAAGIIGNLDTFILETTCIAIDRLQCVEKIINQDFERAFDRELMNTKTKYTSDFYKGVEYLSLSPMTRAKMGILAANKKQQETDPLLKVLKSS